ncbi:SART-1 protein [Limtongia smithiae]|uniref:SART-1 protein n=1 Tax=Limtongia smithiae TaxID=1125753 RepID=UPI0034CEE519
MAEEVALSIEETNKHRLALGLRPIPIPAVAVVESATPDDDAVKRSATAREAREAATGDSQDESSLTLEETNKLRIKLGLRPIPVPGTAATDTSTAPAPDSDEQASANWHAKQEEERQLAENEAAKKRLQDSRDRIERLKFLSGKGLGEADDDDTTDVKKWIKKAKLKRLVATEHEDTAAIPVPEYTANDLKGLKVGHSLDEFDGQEDVILTLKDSNVLDDEEDELVSNALKAKSRLAKNLENKKRKARYTGFEDEESKSGILSRYDDHDDDDAESSRKFFTIDSEVISVASAVAEKQKELEDAAAGKVRVSLDYTLPTVTTSDYMPAEAVKIRKPKKSKNRSQGRKKRGEDDDVTTDNPDSVMADYKPDILEDDDEDLQALLAKQRQTVQKKRKFKVQTAEELAQSIRESGAAEEHAEQVTTGDGLVVDDMTEFIETVGKSQAEDEQEKQRLLRMVKARSASPKIEDTEMQDADKSEDDNSTPPVKAEKVDPDDAADEISTGLEDTTMNSVGIGSVLTMLRSRGIIKAPDEHDLLRQRIERGNAKFRIDMEKRRLLADAELKAQREADRKSGKFNGLTQREREDAAQRENQMRQMVEAREAQKRFKDYKPEVKLEYKDEFGRIMTPKEAFKHLSHQFHGKGSGKLKTEKKLKKIEDERTKESQSLFS